MAEVTGLRNNALPYPIYAQPFGVVFPMIDADGDPVTGATTPDAEVSKNGDTFADCTNESTEIATSSGVYYLLLTATEMTADVVTVIAKSATAGMKTTVITLYPRKLVTLRTGTAQAGAAGTITLDASASAVNDYYNGCVVAGVLDSTNEVRVITDYVGSTKVASVTPNWNTTPDSDDTFTIYLPEGRQIEQADVAAINNQSDAASKLQLWTSAMWWGSASSGSTTTLVSADITAGDTDYLKGSLLIFTSGNIIGQARLITDFNAATDTVTFAPATTQSVTTQSFIVLPGGRSDINSWLGTTAATPTVAGVPEVDITHFGGSAGAFAGGRPEVNTTHAAGTAWGSGAITAASVGTGAIDADAIAADGANEIADALLDRTAGVETGLTVRQWLRLGASALFSKASGLETTTAVYRDFGDSKNRITATVDADGNRTAVTTDAT